jgi:hypothetical protein
LHALLASGRMKVGVVLRDDQNVVVHGKAGFIEHADGRLYSFVVSVNDSARLSVRIRNLWGDEIPVWPNGCARSSSTMEGGTCQSGGALRLVLLGGPPGGRVFSVGSIGWTAALSGDGYQSDTSRITLNVLRAFLQ